MEQKKISVEELLRPRYYLEKEYPQSYEAPCVLHVGEDGELYSPKQGYLQTKYKVTEHEAKTKYPHLFRRMEWWEKRDVSELPEYVRIIDANILWDVPNNCVRHVSEWTNDYAGPLVCDTFPILINNRQLSRLQPATLDDYINYQNTFKNQPK